MKFFILDCIPRIDILRKHKMGGNTSTLFQPATAEVLRRNGYGDLLIGGSKAGGDESSDVSKMLNEQIEGRYAKTRESYIRAIADVIVKLGFGKGKVNPEDSDIKHLAQSMLEVIPGPKSKTKFKDDEELHKKVCKAIADLLNKKFTPDAKTNDEKLINMDLKPEQICFRIAELIEALSTGMHSEFLSIWGQVRQDLKNMVMIKQVLEKIIQELAAKCQDAVVLDVEKSGVKTESLNVAAESAKRLLKELDLQITLVQGLLDTTIDPAEKDIALSLQEDSQQYKLAKKLGLVPGTSEFSPALAGITQGIVSSAALAAQINKSFEKIKKATNKPVPTASDFMKLNKNDMSKLLSDIESMSDLKPEVLVAVKELRTKWHLAHDQGIKEAVGGDKKQSAGGDGEEKTDLDKRVAKQRAERLVILEEFIRKTTTSYQQMVSGIMEMAPELGKKIPLTDKLSDFKNAIIYLIDLNETDINLALIGFNLDAIAREKRETFISSLRRLISSIEDVMVMDVYKSQSSLFSKIKDAANDLLRTIDTFSDLVKKKYGGTEETEQIGGAVMGYLQETDMPKLKQTVLNIKAAAKKFQYFYYIAKFKENIAKTGEELDAYGENYVNVLADAVSGRRMALQQEKEAKINEVKASVPESSRGKYIDYYKKEYDVKDKFYKTLEAVDLYLKNFTKILTSNIDDVRDIKRMLDGVEFIADFYRDIAGNSLAQVFECFREDETKLPEVKKLSNVHYYKSDEEYILNDIVGDHLTGVPVDRLVLINKFMNKLFDNFTALKNIIDAFAKVGEKLGSSSMKIGGLDVKQATFMSPTEIYRNLTEYLKTSSTSLLPETKIKKHVELFKGGRDKYALFMSMIDGFDDNLKKEEFDVFEGPTKKEKKKRSAEDLKKDAERFLTLSKFKTNIKDARIALKEMGDNILDISKDIKADIGDRLNETLTTAKEIDAKDELGYIAYLESLKKEEIKKVVDLSHKPFEAITKCLQEPENVPTDVQINEIKTDYKTFMDKAESLLDRYRKIEDSINFIKVVKNTIISALSLMDSTAKQWKPRVEQMLNDVKANKQLSGQSTIIKFMYDNGYDSAFDAYNNFLHGIANLSLNKILSNEGLLEKELLTDGNKFDRFIGKMRGALVAMEAGVEEQVPKLSLDEKNPEYKISAATGGTRDNPVERYETITRDKKNKAFFINNYRTEDIYFYLMVKAMAAKVLTVIGVYDIFDRYNAIQSITPIRQIVGGADDSLAPEIIPEATELYFRLIRLVEFYMEFLAFDKGKLESKDFGDSAKSIALIPELDGEFSELIKQIFLRGEYTENRGDYSDYEIREIVKSVNSIYLRYKEKAGDKANGAAVDALVKEINRRYGIVKKGEWQKYSDYMRNMRTRQYESMESTDYVILPGETEQDYPRAAPSDRFFNPSVSGTSNLRPGKYNLDVVPMEYYRMLIEFRKRLHDEFKDIMNITSSNVLTLTYSPLIKQSQAEIVRAKSPGEKYDIAKKLILGTGIFIGADVTKTFMFHETVVYGLNVLGSVYTYLDEFKRIMLACDITKIREQIYAMFDGGKPKPANLDEVAAKISISISGADKELVKKFIVKPDHRYNGRGGLPLGLGVAPMTGALIFANASHPDLSDDNKREMQRYLIDAPAIMECYLSNLFLITANFQNLVDVKFYKTGSSLVHVDFSKLRDYVERIMQDIKHYIDVFRPYINKETLDRYEVADDKNGNLHWLEANLIDGLIKGLPSTSLESKGQVTFDKLTAKINNIFADLIGEYTVGNQTKVESYGETLGKMIFYSSLMTIDEGTKIVKTKFPAGMNGFTNIPQFSKLYARERPKEDGTTLYPAVDEKAAPVDTGIIALYQSEGFTDHTSLLFTFNQILAKYLKQFYDTTTIKIYQPLINSFANGIFSSALTSPDNVWPDIVHNNLRIGLMGDPTAKTVLFASLAVVLKRLTKDINPRTNVSDHLVASLTDVPLYMKENYRANLPVFTKLFDGISKLGEFLKNVIQKTDINLDKKEAAASLTAPNVAPNNDRCIVYNAADGKMPPAIDSSRIFPNGYSNNNIKQIATNVNDQSLLSEKIKTLYVSIIDAIISGSYVLSSATTDVLRELADDPKFFQTHEGFIDMYKNRNGKLPLMPISMTGIPLNGINGPDRSILMPDYNLGDPRFKLLYGTRGVFNKNTQSITWDKMPGVKNIIDTYNGSLQKRDQIDSDKYLKFVNNNMTLLKFAIDTKYYFNYMVPYGVNIFGNEALLGDIDPSIALYEAGKSELSSMMDIVESNDQESKISAIVESIGTGKSPINNRRKERILNIIDLNISPINIHALMREMPLVNIYNYAYTFDQLAEELVGATIGEKQNEIENITSSRKLFVNMIGDPYLVIPQSLYGTDNRLRGTGGLIHRMFLGDSDIPGLGRPKFLSDQVFNKALFGSLVPSANLIDEAGIGASSALARGRDNWETKKTKVNMSVWDLKPSDRQDTLFYMSRDDKGKFTLGVLELGKIGKSQLQLSGKTRFDTKLVRNIFFIMNVWRLMRLKLDRELTQNHSVVTRGDSLVNASITEYDQDEFGQYEMSTDAKNKKYLETRTQ